MKQQCTNNDISHAHLSSSQAMVSFTQEYIQHLKDTHPNKSSTRVPMQVLQCNVLVWRKRNK
jgi:hypothetical protein